MNNIHKERFRIREIRCTVLKPIKLAKPFYDASMGPFSHYHMAILTLVDESGHEGEVEFPVSGIPLLKEIFSPSLLKLEESSYTDIYKKLFWLIRNEGFRGGASMALGNLDRAFYDIASRRKGTALHQYLGAKRDWVHVYASGGSVALSDEALIEECLSYKNEGYSTVKIKAGGHLASHLDKDAKRIEKVRKALGGEIRLAVDTNQAMTVDQTLDFIERIENLDICWLEEPIHSADIMGIEEICSKTTMRISYGESERTKYVFPLLHRAGVQHLQPIAGHIISMEEWAAVGKLAEDNDLMFSCGGTPSLNAQLVASQHEAAMCEYLMPLLTSMEPYYKLMPEYHQGKAWLPDIPGVSIRFDWERLKSEKAIEKVMVWKRDATVTTLVEKQINQ
ncbi:hypothetical protein GCM10028791_35880 [Echinicola sediminis]